MAMIRGAESIRLIIWLYFLAEGINMKNNLSPFEKTLLRAINLFNKTNYNHNHFMQWSSSKRVIEQGLQSGEIIYEVLDVYVAIKSK